MNKKGGNRLKYLSKNFFLDPNGKNCNLLMKQVKKGVDSLIKKQGSKPSYPKYNNYDSRTDIFKIKNPFVELGNIYNKFSESVKVSHPMLLRNVIPLPNFVSLSSNLVSSLLMGNGVSLEDAGGVLESETYCGIFLSNLLGININKSVGFFTWGGTATNFYGLKAGLFKVDKRHSVNGVKNNNVAITSWTGHYSQDSAVNWMGLGEKKLIKVKSNFNHTIDYYDLERTMEKLICSGKKIAVIFSSGGSSSNVWMDDLGRIALIRERVKKNIS